MKRTIWASVTVGLAALMTFGCGNVVNSDSGRPNDSQVSFAGGVNGAFPVKIWALDTAGALFSFSSDNSNTVSTKIVPTVPGGDTLVALDFRPRNGVLYAQGASGKLYWLDKNTGVATLVGAGVAPKEVFGDIDFNPQVDRIRMESGDQNVRLNPANGAATVDTSLKANGAQVNVAAIAYTDPVEASNQTTLFAISNVTRKIYRQGNPSPNDGVLTEVGTIPVAFRNNVGFDIGPDGVGWVALQAEGSPSSTLYRFDASTGTPIVQSDIGGGVGVKSIAVELGAPAITHFAGIDGGNKLVKFDSNDPTTILSSTLITGLQAGDVIVGCDFAPGGDAATGLKVLAVNGTTGRIYNVNLNTAVAAVQSTVAPALVDPTTNTYGVDVDANGTMAISAATGTFALGIVSGQSTQSWRVNVATGAGSKDSNLIYPATDRLALGTPRNTFIPALGFTNNFVGAGNTQVLHGVDVTSSANLPFDEFARIVQGAGTTSSIGEMNLFGTSTCELDIDPAGNIWFCSQRAVAGTGTFVADNFSTLYRVSPQTGGSQTVTRIGGTPLKHFTTFPTLNANLTTGP
ncbi:DUF4394 domain-containing protein [bacterium]|nr:DUF4394 domain-containing protein [bacterium]